MAAFSVLMSLYVREKPVFLRACLESLCAQTLMPNEVVLVCDGALTDDLESVLTDFQAALPLKIVRLPENVGLGKALNAGLNACSHNWVFRMDTDDIALNTRFETQWRFIQNYPDLALLGGQIREFTDSPNDSHATRFVPLRLPEIIEFAKKRNPFNHMTVAYRKDAVLAAGGYQHLLYMEDYHLWLRLLTQGFQAANLPDVLVQARTGAGMLSRRRGWVYVKSEWQLCVLKQQWRVQSKIAAFWTFLLRAVPRMLPEKIVALIYRVIRSK